MIKNQHDSSDPDPLFVWWFRWWLIKQFDHTIWQKSQWKNAKKSGSQIDPRKTTGDSFLKVSPLLRGLLYITLSRIQLQSNSLAKVTSVQSSIGILTLRSLINLIPRDSQESGRLNLLPFARGVVFPYLHILTAPQHASPTQFAVKISPPWKS